MLLLLHILQDGKRVENNGVFPLPYVYRLFLKIPTILFFFMSHFLEATFGRELPANSSAPCLLSLLFVAIRALVLLECVLRLSLI
jgi:hypothetical protein